jgi:hypothetical protein
MTRRPVGVSSSTLCRDVLAALERVFMTEGPDEPDLALNIAYVRGRLSLQRLASATPWTVPADTAAAIRDAIAAMLASTRPGELERQLLSFPGWVLRALDRRRAPRSVALSLPLSRRHGELVVPRPGGDGGLPRAPAGGAPAPIG